jgi:hypothetical protein
MRLHRDSRRDDLFLVFDENGDVARTGFLELGEDDVVRFVDDWTPPVVNSDPAGP